MFKSLKEARTFTAHLDALANEIESLEDISPEMRTRYKSVSSVIFLSLFPGSINYQQT